MSPLKVQFAVACLGRLQAQDHTEKEIAQNAGIPLEDCMDITSRLENAGIVRRNAEGQLVLASESCSSLQVLEAVWGPAKQPAFRALYGKTKGASVLMRRWMKQGIIAAVVLAGWVGVAQAVNPDTMVVSVTPTVTYSVSIASPMVQGYAFGNVALSFTTISTVAIVVSNNGNVSEYFSLAISNSSPGTWTPQAAAGANQFSMRAHFTGAGGAQPADATFATALTTGVPGAAAALYGQASTKTNAATTNNLWLRLAMPTSMTGAVVAQTMTLTINGQDL